MSRAKPPIPPILVRGLRAAFASGRRGLRMLLRRLGRQPGHLVRVLGRLTMRSRARRQGQSETENP
ncbi:MAG: hypothetical protein EOP92_36115 [Lysobacteraceae bacterium]|nr:MAG: hypothetical protein EOP92_36115 [Xanthomonadaceae bacterium]